MNKNLHKVIFCAARSIRVAVHECARSAGKGASRTTGSSAPASGGGAGIATAITTGMGLVAILASMGASAQIVASPSAPGTQRPTVLVAPNGVPLVQITTPSAAGVSRNTYSQFDIQNNGAILNNSRTNVQTQLGGWVQGNPWLATGTARVIVNEVVSGNPTQLRGALEVAGTRAEVVVANPAGIAVDGGAFINASRVTLTTGTPQYNLSGGLDGYAVRGGTVSVDGKGLDLSQTDYAAILARAVQVNAGIWASELKVVTGANDISADHSQVAPMQGAGAAPAFALDVAQLGGMYANKIFLVGTEAGVGVRNAGAIQASANSASGAPATLAGAGQFVVTSAGRLETSGTLQADTQLRIDAPSIANSGTIAAGTDLHIASSAGDLVSSGLIQAPHLDLSSSAQIDNRGGTIRQTGSASLTVSAPSLSNTAGGTIGIETLASTGTSASTPSAGGTASSTTTASTSPSTASVDAGTTTPPASTTPPTPGTMSAATAILNDGGHIEAGGALVLATPQINNAGGRIAVADLAVSGPTFSNAGGTLAIANGFSANVGAFDNTGGVLRAGNLSIASTGDLINQDGTLSSDADATLNAGGSLNNTRGTISAAGGLNASAAGALTNAAGSLTANNAVVLAAQALNNASGTITSAQAGVQVATSAALLNTQGRIHAATDLQLQAGSLNNTGGTLRAEQDATLAVAGPLTNDGTLSAARHVTVTAGSLSGGGLLGAGIAADGSMGSAGDLSVSTSGALAAHGQNLAAGNATLQGASVDLSGSTTSAANIAVTATQGELATSGATVATPGTLILRADSNGAQSLVNQGGTLSAGALDVRSANLDNSAAGQILQTGSGATSIAVSGQIDNNTGVIASNGNTAISAGALSNQGGAVRAVNGSSLDLAVAGALDNSQQGTLSADGNATLRAGTLKNDGGKFTAGADLAATVQGQASNALGLIAANGNTTVAAGAFDNSAGTVAAVGQDLSITTGGATINAGGTLQAGGNTTLVNAGLDNSAGKVYGTHLHLDTHGQQFTNTQGILVASQTAQLQTGALVNDAGLIQAGTGLSIDTHGQSLSNTNTLGNQLAGTSATPQGILSSGALQLATGAIDNTTGYIRAADALTATTGDLTNNGGAVLGGSNVAIDTQGGNFTNNGGHVQAVGDLSLNAGTINNANGGLIRAGGTTTLAAAQIDNSATLGTDQGIEGTQVAITTNALVNQSGAVRASGNATITSGGTIDNTAGLISAADTLTLQDPNRADPAAKTLAIVNTGGTLAGGTAANAANGTTAFGGIVIDAARYQLGQVAGGTLASANDLAIALTQDISNSASLSTSGALSLSTTGKLSNAGQLVAGRTLTVSANAIDNAASGELSGADTHLVAGSVSNRGLIDSNGETRIDASTSVDNLGTGRIYGDHIAIGTGTLTNDAETINGQTSSGAIVSRGDLDIGAAQINNRNGALIHSEGDLYVGGALDANGYAIGTAAQLNNHSADLESVGSMTLDVANVDNRDTQMQVVPGAQVTQSSTSEWKTYLSNLGLWTTTTTSTTDGIANVRPAVISAGGDLTLTGNLVNRDSKVLAGYDLTIHRNVDSQSTQGQQSVSVHTTVLGIDAGGNTALFDLGTQTTATAIDLTAYGPPQGHQATSAVGGAPGTASSGSGSGSASGAGTAKSGQGAGAILEVPSAVGSGPGVTGASADGAGSASQGVPMVVRTAAPGTQLPTASLFRTHPQSTARFLIETDPRFANYGQWLGSDYLFSQLGLDPNNLQKRLGDGFYEQRLIREQIAQLTGNRFLDGYSDDQSEYLALMDAGATFAKEYHLTPGIALTPEQMAQLTSDIVWMVSQTVTLPDGSTQQVLVPQVYVRVQPGDIDGHGALLSAERVKIDTQPGAGAVTNSGTIAGRSLVSITADDIRNVDGGRITGGAVGLTARNDLDNIGATIDARKSLSLAAGHDIHIASTTSATTLNGAVNGQVVDRVAGVYVSDPKATLSINAGNDLNVTGANIANRGAGGMTTLHAGNDINLGTVTESSSFSYVAPNGKGFIASSQSHEVGSTIATNGTTLITAGQDINARQANVNSGEGLLIVNAGRDLNIVDGQSTRSTAFGYESTKKGTLSSSTTSLGASEASSTSVGSSFSGGLVSMHADNNVNIVGSHISGTQGVGITAGNELNVVEGRSTTSSSAYIHRSTSGLMKDPFLTKDSAGGNGIELRTDNASASSITSSQGGVLLEGNNSVYLRGAEVSAAKDVNIKGGDVTIVAATNEAGLTLSEDRKGGSVSAVALHPPGHGFGAKSQDTYDAQATSLARSSLQGANINITAEDANGVRGAVTIAGTTISTPGTLKLEGDSVNLALQSTDLTMTQKGSGKDLMWQRTSDSGTSKETLNYNQINAGGLQVNANRVTVGMNARDSLEALAQQPGMGWVQQINSDPNLQGKVDWQKLDEANRQWNYGKQGLTPEGAAVVMAVVTWATWGAASGAGAAASDAAATSGMAAVGEGGFVAAGGMTVSSVVGGAVTAGVSALAGEAAVALLNNQGDIGAALHDLGSSANVKGLVTAMLTGGVLAGLDLNPNGLPTVNGGAQGFMDQLGQNLKAAGAKALINTAVNGGSLESNLASALKSGVLDTVAAQGAYALGDLKAAGVLDDFTQKVAHAIAGCAVGAARTDGSCSAGAIGAVIGEISASVYGRDEEGNVKPGAVEMAGMFAALAAAITGADAQGIALAQAAGANAAANNALSLRGTSKLVADLRACSGGTGNTCDVNQMRQDAASDAAKQAERIDSACGGSGSNLSQCMQLGNNASTNLEQLMWASTYADTPEKKALVNELMWQQVDDITKLRDSLSGVVQAAGVVDRMTAVLVGAGPTIGVAIGGAIGSPKVPSTLQPFTNPPQAPVIPSDWVSLPGRTPGSTIYYPPGTNPNAPGSTYIRVMPPGATPVLGLQDGYWISVKNGQPINPSTGGTGARGDTHIPLPPNSMPPAR
ncbi:filamentous hemagglutinin [Variovorax sp. HW608]|uniref:two-partner secretion domain-containing protein n=2 Tax=Variovorax sp. HW608 TaxID=1034889 RepID=UPI00081FC895|nr:filamentous hemagglutinin N-terminal domain-containing protein [Variovorax sp. HW608]SCK34240.1 filamentous hemagglutinin [Variovorax sp. HW608]